MHYKARLSLGKGWIGPSSVLQALNTYLERYQHEYCEKYYDGDLATLVLDLLKTNITAHNRKVRREVIKGLKSKKVTKMFYDKQAMYNTLQGFKENFVDPKNHHEDCKLAFEILREFIKPVKLEPLLVYEGMDVSRNIKNLKSSAGALAYGKQKGDIVNEMIQQTLKYKNDLTQRPLMALAMRRSQLSGLVDERGIFSPKTVKLKGRLVWCLEAGQILFESQYARPLTEHLAAVFPNIATGKKPHEIRTKMLNWGYKSWISIDYSKYDSTLQSWVLKKTFELVKEFFDDEYHAELDWVRDNFLSLPILMPNGEIEWKHKGIPSGSYFTQVVGSIANAYMMLTYLCHKYKCNKQRVLTQLRSKDNYNELTFMAMGDDNIIFTVDPIDKKDLATFMKWKFGIEVSEEKSEQGTSKDAPSFLKRAYYEAGEYRDLTDLLLNMLHPERVREYKKKGFSPWHVMYGYYITYPMAFQEFVSEEEILQGMHKDGGIRKLESMDISSLPGSLGAWANLDKGSWFNLIKSKAAIFGEDVA